MSRATALGIAGVAASALGPLAANPSAAASLAQAAALSAAKTLPLDVAEWSFMWVNVKRADTARGSFIGGQQMYVEYMVPTRVTQAVPDRAGARRRRTGTRLDGHARRTARLVPASCGRRDTRCTSSIVRVTGGRRSTLSCTAPSRSAPERWKACRASSSSRPAAPTPPTSIARTTRSGRAPASPERLTSRSSSRRRVAATS